VNFIVNGQVLFTATSKPYQYNFTVPQVPGTLTIGATAVDLGGNVGTAQNVSVTVIPDPGTTVTGHVVDQNGSPVTGATVTVSGLSATSQSDGSFSISGVPTVSGSITASATVAVTGVTLRGSSASVPPVRGGVTSVGNIIVTQAAFETNIGTQVPSCDDCSAPVTLPFPFTYFGQTYNSLFANNNGNLTFSSGDWTFTPSLNSFSVQPRISPFWDDLIACGTIPQEGLYVNTTIPGEVVVTWLHQQIYECSGDDTIQAILFSDGRIQFGYNGITTIALPNSTSSGTIVGITPGGNVVPTQEDYLSNPSFSINSQTAPAEFFIDGTTPFNLDGGFVLFAPNGTGGYAVQVIPPTGSGSTPNASNTASTTLRAATTTTQTSSGVTVQGTAYDAQGLPLAGAQILVTCSRALSYQGTATTDQNGRYSISDAPYGGISIVAVKGGTKVAVGAEMVQSGSSTTIDLHPPTSPPKSPPTSMLNLKPKSNTAGLEAGATSGVGGTH
jgi:hypothetical protein